MVPEEKEAPAPGGPEGGPEEKKAWAQWNPLEEPDKLERILQSVTDMIEDLANVVAKIVDKLTETLDGARVGREVGEFYKSLKESGVPDEVAIELTKQYFEKRVRVVEEIIKSIKEAL